jgi:hypothetical protein
VATRKERNIAKRGELAEVDRNGGGRGRKENLGCGGAARPGRWGAANKKKNTRNVQFFLKPEAMSDEGQEQRDPQSPKRAKQACECV